MGSKLTIHKKTRTEENGWFNSFQYTSNIIDDIIDPSGGNIEKMLTAIPSPFARMHLFETAFSFAIKHIRNNSNNFNEKTNLRIFHKMISECFDMFELLFNYKIHKNAGDNINIKSWNFEYHINNLINSEYTEHRILGQVLKKHYINNQNLKENNIIYLFYLNNELLGATSPFTGFFTKPDIKNLSLRKPNGQQYFSEIVPIWKRDEEFLIAVYYLFNKFNNPRLVNSAKKVLEYLEISLNFIENKELKNKLENIFNNIKIQNLPEFDEVLDESNTTIRILDATIPTKKLQTLQNLDSELIIKYRKLPEYCKREPLVLNEKRDSRNQQNLDLKIPKNCGEIKDIEKRILPDLNLNYPFIVVDDFLEDYLIRLNYPINTDYFIKPELKHFGENDSGVLIPVKREFFDFFDINDIKEYLTITKKSDVNYLVELKIPTKRNNQFVSLKKYYKLDKSDDDGQIIDVKCFFAFFPLFLVKNENKFNNFYKIMMVDAEETQKNLLLKFYDNKNNEIKDNPNAEKFYKKVIRNKKTDISEGTIYYETNFPFSYLELNIQTESIHNKSNIKGLIIPFWKEIELGNRSYNIAIDFGTTNSHVVLLEVDRQSQPITFTVGEKDLQTVLLNATNNDINKSLTERYETGNAEIEMKFFSRIKHEFVPSIIGEGNNPSYNFPIRTAISTNKDFVSNSSSLLGNINISFIFEKDVVRDDEKIYTNLKWEITEGDNEILIREFIRELLYLVRNKILLNQGNPSKSKLIWFKPLSMFPGHQAHYRRIWDELYQEIFLPLDNFRETFCLTESCAPYFYYIAQNKAISSKPILIIDIGGGSTDVSFFLHEEPIFGTSFNFAANAIWNPGLEKRHKTLEGIFIKYGRDFITKRIKTYSKENKDMIDRILKIFTSQTGPGIQSENIFNLYFTWDRYLQFTDELRRDPIIKFLILLHFSSIIYHCSKLLKHRNYEKPEYICVSGRGSKYLSIIDPTPNLRQVSNFLDGFVNDIFDKKFSHAVRLEKVQDEKEATSIGGLYLLEEFIRTNKFKDTENSETYYGELNPKFKRITYSEIDENLKNSVVQNINDFLDLFFNQNKNFDFYQQFTIQLPKTFAEINKELKNNTKNFLEIGLQKRMRYVNETDQVNEPLFFYPLISMIYELTKMFYEKDN